MTAIAVATRTPLRPLFIATILAGSFLLFLVQPMFARMALPRLGGSPSVWNVAMLFYQAALLGGYLYAHALQRLALRSQVILHVTLFALAGLFLPVAAADWLPDPGTTPPALWLLGLLAVSIGPLFFIVSAQAPLMQAWFARSDDPDAASPTFLYAASNVGSLAALLAYPLIVEPTTRLATQGIGWSIGFAMLLALVGVSGLAVLRNPGAPRPGTIAAGTVTHAQRRRWTLLALIPSGLLLSTTTHLTTDIMAMPLLWVVPLAAYLLSFIIAFAPGIGARATRAAVAAAPVLLVMLGTSAFLGVGLIATIYAVGGIILLFAIALALHGTLAAEAPAAENLTEYFLWISVGGALGGLLCALVAPLVFDWGYEHPLLLLAAALVLPARPLIALKDGWAATWLAWYLRWPALLVTAALAAAAIAAYPDTDRVALFVVPMFVIAALAIGDRPRLAFHLLMLMLALGGWRQLDPATHIERTRSFFGIYTVKEWPGRQTRELQHGTTLHGVQSIDPARATRPTSYYALRSGVGRVFTAAPLIAGPRARMAFVGLGTGTLACYARPGQSWTAFEIDPAMIRIARDPRLFSYLARCQPQLRIVTGDARLMLSRTAPASFDMLAVDAFSSDAIPLHLMTAEAFAIYTRALAPDGVLLIHVSNRFLDLEPVVAAIAVRAGWSARALDFSPQRTANQTDTASDWIVLARTPERLGAVISATRSAPGDWRGLRDRAGAAPWTDDFASILPVLKKRF